MTRLLAAAALAVAALPVAAEAVSFSFVNPANQCTYTVTGPSIIVHPGPPGIGGYQVVGGVNESVTCP